MSFSDHKITAFTHRIADLPDQPNLPADELKARFDSSPEELRAAHNAVCDDADRLEARVAGIVAATFGDSIDKSMLSDELQDELDALEDSVDTLSSQKCEVYFGTYTGNGSGSSDISVPENTKVVILHKFYSSETYIALEGVSQGYVRLNNGILNPSHSCVNESNKTYGYICIG